MVLPGAEFEKLNDDGHGIPRKVRPAYMAGSVGVELTAGRRADGRGRNVQWARRQGVIYRPKNTAEMEEGEMFSGLGGGR